MNLALFLLLLVVRTAHSQCDNRFFLSYENHAIDNNNNIIIRHSLLGYLASETTCTCNISSG